MENSKLSRPAHLCIIIFATAAALYVAIKYLLPALIPILIAAVISAVTRPIAKKASEKSKMPYKLCGILTASLFIFFAAYAAVLISEKLLHEMTEAVKMMMEGLDREDNIIRRAMDMITRLRDRIPFLSSTDSAYSAEIYDMLMEWATGTVGKISEAFAKGCASFITSLPDLIFACIVSVIALFYLTADADGVRAAVVKLIPGAVKTRAKNISDRLGKALSGYVRAYISLMLITFGELFLGFVILRIRYAFFLALLVAAIDILPVLGVGSVLLPWALFMFLSGNTSRAVGLLVLFGIMYAVRQFTEPRLVGRFMGLHPLLTLTGAFVGYSLFGLWGMILSPIILYGVKLAAEGGNK